MNFSTLDLTAFIGYFVVVAVVAIVVSRREKVAADYFLAGRHLPWWGRRAREPTTAWRWRPTNG